MLKHTGVRRAYLHDFRLATLLSLTAGSVNAVGFLGFSVLTTNVTGHAALFAEKISLADWRTTSVIAVWMALFLAGAVSSSLIINLVGKGERYSFLIPLLGELGILIMVAVLGNFYSLGLAQRQFLAGSLLFAMGMQNALVSVISGSVVRTTHLTGTFTDLGIDLSDWITGRFQDANGLRRRMVLKIAIISSFITGAVLGGVTFRVFSFYSFYLPVFLLVLALLYDSLRVSFKRYYRRIGRSIKRKEP